MSNQFPGAGNQFPGAGGDGTALTDEQLQDKVAAFIRAGTNIIATYDDAAGTLTLSATGGSGGGLTAEQVRDTLASFIVGGTNVTVTHDDDANTLTIAATDTNTQITDEQLQDKIAAFIRAGSNVSVDYDDTNGTFTISSTDTNTDTQLTDEQVQDKVAAFLQAGSNVTITYDDAAGTLTIASTGGSGGGLTAEQVRDTIASFIVGGTNVTVTHNDSANTLTIASDLPNAVEKFDALPDISNYTSGQVILVAGKFYIHSTAPGDNVFAGVIGNSVDHNITKHGVQTDTSYVNSVGRWTSNPDKTLLWMTGDTDANQPNINAHTSIAIKQSVYRAAKGSNEATGDTVSAVITVGSNAAETFNFTIRSFNLITTAHDGTVYLIFNGTAPHDSAFVTNDGEDFTLKIQKNGSDFITHSATAHWVEYPLSVDGEQLQVTIGNAFPLNPVSRHLHLFDAAASGLTNAFESDGTTAKTTAKALDLFRFDGTSWQYVGFIGDTTPSVQKIFTEGRDPVAGDGKNEDIWIRIYPDERAEIWEKISGNWVRLTGATKTAVPQKIFTQGRDPVAGDGVDEDIWIRIYPDERSEIWEKVSGNWVRLTGATKITDEILQDKVAAFIRAGTNITATYDDTNGTLTLASTGGGDPTANAPYGIFTIDGGTTVGAEGATPVALPFAATLMRSHNATNIIARHATQATQISLEPGTYEITNHFLLAPANLAGTSRANFNIQIYDGTNILDEKGSVGYLRGSADLDSVESFDSHHIITLTAATTIQLRIGAAAGGAGYTGAATAAGGTVDVRLIGSAVPLSLDADIVRNVHTTAPTRARDIGADEQGNFYVSESEIGSDAQGTWTKAVIPNYVDAFDTRPGIESVDVFYYDYSEHAFFESVSGNPNYWSRVTPSDVFLVQGDTWLGEFDTEADALAAIDSFVNTFAYYAFFDGQINVLTNGTYVAPTSTPTQRWIWRNVSGEKAAEIAALEKKVNAHIDSFQKGPSSPIVSVNDLEIVTALSDPAADTAHNYEQLIEANAGNFRGLYRRDSITAGEHKQLRFKIEHRGSDYGFSEGGLAGSRFADFGEVLRNIGGSPVCAMGWLKTANYGYQNAVWVKQAAINDLLVRILAVRFAAGDTNVRDNIYVNGSLPDGYNIAGLRQAFLAGFQTRTTYSDGTHHDRGFVDTAESIWLYGNEFHCYANVGHGNIFNGHEDDDYVDVRLQGTVDMPHGGVTRTSGSGLPLVDGTKGWTGIDLYHPTAQALSENIRRLQQEAVISDDAREIEVLTQAAYTALATKDAATLYIIVG